jgi:Tfp pilus assembly protein PilF
LDALAEAWWRLGQLASVLATQSERERWLRKGQNDYDRALALAPFSEKYLLAAGFQALTLRNSNAALSYFSRAIDVNPASALAYAGLAELALRNGDRARARLYAQRSRNLNNGAAVLRELERLGD